MDRDYSNMSYESMHGLNGDAPVGIEPPHQPQPKVAIPNPVDKTARPKPEEPMLERGQQGKPRDAVGDVVGAVKSAYRTVDNAAAEGLDYLGGKLGVRGSPTQ